MRISGDADLARRLQRLAERFDPDWQQPFVAVFGEIIGVQVANAFAAALRHARAAGADFAEAAAEYVTEESRDVVPRAELDAFHDDVDTLRDDAARLAARVARLRGALDDRAGAPR
jgi:ubiquinone biosynthesis protein UbiJ